MSPKLLTLGSLLATLTFGSLCPTPALATEPTDDGPIPAILVHPDDPAQTPDPVCLVCAVVTTKQSTSSSESSATVRLVYDGDFQGDVELVVWLDSDERVSLWLTGVVITDGEPVEIEVAAGSGWSWDAATFAWTRYYAAA